MGVEGISVAAKSRGKVMRLFAFKGRGIVVAVDASSQLYHIKMGQGRLLYEEGRAAMLVRRMLGLVGCGLHPLVVFDGGLAPAKLAERQRRTRGGADNLPPTAMAAD
jgi:hypothetical protein